MIFHTNRATFKSDVSPEQRAASYELLRRAGAENPAVRSFAVGATPDGEYEYGAVFAFDDLDGYYRYLSHPVHVQTELDGIALLEKFEAFDITDSNDPGIWEKIKQIQARHFAETPELAKLIAQAHSFVAPGAGDARPTGS